MEYKISKGKTEAIISDTGGIIHNFTIDGRNIFFPYEEHEGKARGGCFVCAPHFGTLPKYGERKHGHLRDLRARIVDKKSDNIELYFSYRGTERYPWKFEHILIMSIEEKKLFLSFFMKRLDDGLFDAPQILPAVHPYFAGPANNFYVSDGVDTRFNFHVNGNRFSTSKNTALMISQNQRYSLSWDYTEGPSDLVLWTDAPEKYFCVEPILGNKRAFQIGDSLKFTMLFSIE